MKIISSDETINSESVVTIGVFDGVHIGHQKLLNKVNELSGENFERVVVTFDKHPAYVLAPERAPKMLVPLHRRLELLEQSGSIDIALVISFDQERAQQSATDFVQEVLVEQLKARKILIGENFAFGHQRKGNFGLLKEIGKQYDFEVESTSLVSATNDLPASSTLVRQYISVGEVEKAKHILGRAHEVTGIVVSGDNMGTDLGYPTANTEVSSEIAVPADGVYSGRVILSDGKKYKSAISIGVRPMFHEDNISVIEPHLLDYEGDLYGQTITIEFENKLRDQQIFDSVEDLIAQIDLDIQQVRNEISI